MGFSDYVSVSCLKENTTRVPHNGFIRRLDLRRCPCHDRCLYRSDNLASCTLDSVGDLNVSRCRNVLFHHRSWYPSRIVVALAYETQEADRERKESTIEEAHQTTRIGK